MNQDVKYLRNVYSIIKSVLSPNNKRHEDVYITPKWLTFEGFLKDNWTRLQKAQTKWNHQKNIVFEHEQIVKKQRRATYLRFKRKLPSRGFTKKNTVFTSASEMMKYMECTHKYIFEDKLLSTRDIYNILKKRGIKITMVTLTNRLNTQKDLFATPYNSVVEQDKKSVSMLQFAKDNNICYSRFRRWIKKGMSVEEAIELSKY